MGFRNRYISEYSWAENIYLDLRPADAYRAGHIPGSLSLPLFGQEEIRIVLSKRKKIAELESLQLHFRKWLDELNLLGPFTKALILVCADGGHRSQFAWDTLKSKQEVYILKGGYRSYRRGVREALTRRYPFMILAGKTGSGKTAMLRRLKESGEQVLDIEMLAGSSGSVFGLIGTKGLQPTQEQFENNLAEALQKTDSGKWIFAEQELNYIGKCQIPDTLMQQFASAPRILLNIPFSQRVKLLTDTYAGVDDEALIKGISSLQARMGKDQSEALAEMVRRKEYPEVAAGLLEYYDNADSYRTVLRDHDLVANGEDLNSLYDAILKAQKKRLLK